MKKQTAIIIFYTAYFIWLLVITYISPDIYITNLFATIIVAFYFIFFRESGDAAWFIGTVTIVTAYLFFNGTIYLDDFTNINSLIYLPVWIPLTWGTTVIALRKFYLIMNKGLF